MTFNGLWAWFGLVLMADIVFASLRAVLLHVRLPHLVSLREQTPARVDRLLDLLDHSYLVPSLRMALGVTHFLAAALGWSLLPPGQPIGLSVVLLALLGLVVLGLEFAIESYLLKDVERTALHLVPLTALADLLLRPFAWLVQIILGSPTAVKRTMGSVTDDELKSWVKDGQQDGSLERDERKMIYSIFQFGDTLCREIMVPRMDVLALDVETPLQEAARAIHDSGHSRVPVYEEAIDNVIGLLYAKDLLQTMQKDNRIRSIRELLRPAIFVPEAKKVDDLLHEMQESGVHIVVVVDEYGGMAGLVTLEDIMEEIVGEIRDEYDQGEELPYQKLGPDEAIVIGRYALDDFNELFDTHLTKELADTIGGYIYGQIGRVPQEGESLVVEGWLLTVEQVSGRRIRRVHVSRLHPGSESAEKNEPGE